VDPGANSAGFSDVVVAFVEGSVAGASVVGASVGGASVVGASVGGGSVGGASVSVGGDSVTVGGGSVAVPSETVGGSPVTVTGETVVTTGGAEGERFLITMTDIVKENDRINRTVDKITNFCSNPVLDCHQLLKLLLSSK